jgi:hypothetical protein
MLIPFWQILGIFNALFYVGSDFFLAFYFLWNEILNIFEGYWVGFVYVETRNIFTQFEDKL